MNKIQTRCQYTPEGLTTFGKQKLGYARENRDGNGYNVLWDGRKSWSHYAKSFIDVSPLIALYTEEQVSEIVKEQEPVVTPEVILRIEASLEKIKNTGITKRGLEVLLKDFCGTKVGLYAIREVLSGIEKLKARYFRP